MADNDRWRDEQERYGYRDDDRGRWRNAGGREDFGRGRRGDDRGASFYSGPAGEARGYGGYGGGGDVRGGRFSDERRSCEREPFGRAYRGGDYNERDRGYGGQGRWWREREPGSTDIAFGHGFGTGYEGRDWSRRGAYGQSYEGERSEERYGGYGQHGERGFWDRASDEVSSWFGDEDAARRRRMDQRQAGEHRGRGPKGYTRSDDRIREDVCDRLTDDPWIDASDIEVSVASCEVTLSGTVDSREAKRRAEDCADQVSGVRHVQNNLRVSQETSGGTAAMGLGSATAAVATDLAGRSSAGSGSAVSGGTPGATTGTTGAGSTTAGGRRRKVGTTA